MEWIEGAFTALTWPEAALCVLGGVLVYAVFGLLREMELGILLGATGMAVVGVLFAVGSYWITGELPSPVAVARLACAYAGLAGAGVTHVVVRLRRARI